MLSSHRKYSGQTNLLARSMKMQTQNLLHWWSGSTWNSIGWTIPYQFSFLRVPYKGSIIMSHENNSLKHQVYSTSKKQVRKIYPFSFRCCSFKLNSKSQPKSRSKQKNQKSSQRLQKAHLDLQLDSQVQHRKKRSKRILCKIMKKFSYNCNHKQKS